MKKLECNAFIGNTGHCDCVRTMPALLGSCSVPRLRILMCNDTSIPLDYMVCQHKYDSVHGRFNGTIAMSEEDRKEFFVLKRYTGMSSGRRKSTGIWLYLGDEHCGPFYCDTTDSCIWLLDEKTHSSLQSCGFPQRGTTRTQLQVALFTVESPSWCWWMLSQMIKAEVLTAMCGMML